MLAAGNYSAAERYYNKALDLNPQSELVLLDLAVLREDQDRRDDAIAIYKKILQINPNDDRAHKRLAELYFAAHASAEAPGEAGAARPRRSTPIPATPAPRSGCCTSSAAISTAPRPSSTWCSAPSPTTIASTTISAPSIASSSENDKAATEFERIPEDNEHYVESRLQLAYLYDKQNEYDHALAALKQALAKKPNDTEIIGFMVGVYQEKKDYPTAIELAQQDGRAGAEERQVPFHARRALRREQAAPRQHRGDAQGDRAQSEQRAGAQLPRLHLRRSRQPSGRGREADQARARDRARGRLLRRQPRLGLLPARAITARRSSSWSARST